MEVKQIYDLMNNVTGEVIGKSDLLKEDLSNVVDIGTEVFNASAVDKYVKSLVNHIGKVIFVNRPYSGNVPSVMMDSWEFGSILEKISADLPTATENESWELTDGTDYSPNVFHQPKVSAKFFNDMITFEIPMSFTERQVKQSFSSAAQLNGFMSMLYNSVDKAMTVKIDSLIMRTINNMIAETLLADYTTGTGKSKTVADFGSKSGIKAVNLLKLYNDRFSQTLTAEKALTTAEFIRFASMQMSLYIDRMSKMSTLFKTGSHLPICFMWLCLRILKRHLEVTYNLIRSMRTMLHCLTLKQSRIGREAAQHMILTVFHLSILKRLLELIYRHLEYLRLCLTVTLWELRTLTGE